MSIRHTVRQGEGISSLAAHYGFAPETLWEHPDNAHLRQLRRDANVLYPGDVIAIPDTTIKHESCAIDQRHVFRRRGVPARFELQLMSLSQAKADVPYVLTVDGSRHEGRTDGDGVLRHFVPNGARAGTLRYEIEGHSHELRLDFGGLDPIDELDGVQKRLENMGYRCDERGVDGPRTRLALQCFQVAMQLEVTGERDAPTLQALLRLHESTDRFPPPEAA